MQPPPRKVKPTVAMKNIHADQLSKLQQKHQQDLELLEDVRLFSKQRAVVEKEYAQGATKQQRSPPAAPSP
ncbi:hypothetical protein LSAT2_011297 [Lamellibrachia satsuma]|nr:hypothetical protein LSAT2_011297 [Lamellibrachia satsuma]